MEIGFNSYYVRTPGASGGSSMTIDEAVTGHTSDYTIPATSGMPKVLLKNVTKEQFDEFMQGYDSFRNDPELKASLQEMARDNVTLQLGVSETLSSQADPLARATIVFRDISDINGNNQSVMPGTSVEIVVKASAIKTNLTWEDTFKGIIAHELTT